MGLLGDLTNVGFDSVQAKIIAQAIGGISTSWGMILGNLSDQTDLQNALNAKQNLLPQGNIGASSYNILGSDLNRVINISSFYFSGNKFLPSNTTSEIGSDTNYLKNLYTQTLIRSDGILELRGNNGIALDDTAQDTSTYTCRIGLNNWCFRPFTSNSNHMFDLGNNSYYWNGTYSKSFYLGSNVYIDSNSNRSSMQLRFYDPDTSTAKYLQLYGTVIRPSINNDITLGDGSYGYKAIYMGHTNAQHPDAGAGIINPHGYLDLCGRGGTYGGILVFGKNNTQLGSWTSQGIIPSANNTYKLGNDNNAWTGVYTIQVVFRGYQQTNQIIDTLNAQSVRIRSNNKAYRFGVGTGGDVSVSDERLKKNVIDMPNGAIKILNQLRPIKFDFNSEDSKDSIRAGFIAQEVDTIPEMYSVVYHPETENVEDDYYGIDYAGFVPYLVKAIQELSAQVSDLRQQIGNVTGESNGYYD